jgi:exodeoxyribonuclease-3
MAAARANLIIRALLRFHRRTHTEAGGCPALVVAGGQGYLRSPMPLSVATWNINSVRLRAASVRRLMDELAPDILCLQECKAPVDRLPDFADAGYPWRVARDQKGYNGVAILSRVPIEDAGHIDMCGRGDARHVAARTESGVVVHNFYVPADGDLPDPAANPKFAHKLDFLAELAARFGADPPRRAILAGDHNVAPRPDDVWSHRQLLRVVSHTPVETAGPGGRASGGRLDRRGQRADPHRAALHMVVLSLAGLGAGGQGPTARPYLGHGGPRRHDRNRPGAEGGPRVGPAVRPRPGRRQLRRSRLTFAGRRRSAPASGTRRIRRSGGFGPA